MKTRIGIVDDDEEIRRILAAVISSHGYAAVEYESGEDIIRAFHEPQPPELLLLDVQLQGMNGFEACRAIRTMSNVPILFISCLMDGSDIVKGLEWGGDDYIVKPFDLHQLMARIKSNLRRSEWSTPVQAEDQHFVRIRSLEIDLMLHQVKLEGKLIHLSNKEYHILALLASDTDKTFSSAELCQKVWGSEDYGEITALKVHISNLRHKLGGSPEFKDAIRTIRGFGYQFCVQTFPAG